MQVYVDEAPLPYPMNHIIFFSTTFVIGFILFAVFLFHLAFSDAVSTKYIRRSKYQVSRMQ